MVLGEVLDRFEFYYYSFFHKEIGEKITNYLIVLIDLQGFFCFDFQIVFGQLYNNCFFIDIFKKPKSELIKDLVCSANDLMSNFLVFHLL